MSKNMRAKQMQPMRSGSCLKDGVERPPLERSLCRHLSMVEAVHVVYTATDDEGVIHVYSVVPDYGPDFYDKLLRRERSVEKEFPELTFEFHVRAHQRRHPDRAVPIGSQPIFVR